VRACPQGIPEWQARALGPLEAFSAGKPFTYAAWEAALANATLPVINYNADTTEDCLFLDVYVPQKVFEQASQCTDESKGAPVLVWVSWN
jgi:carboxylesterase type B